MSVETKQRRVSMAMGKEKADLVIKNANIINVFTKEIMQGDIAILGEQIVGIGDYEGNVEIDAKGKFVCPGLIDSHLHIESTMVTPKEFAKFIIPFGTTTIIADPHEIANVCGINGINFMLQESKGLPLNIYYMAPSCVPSIPNENNGADLSAELLEPLLYNDRVLGLGEVMSFPSVISGEEGILKKIELFDSKIIDGHSPGLRGKELNAYKTSGVMTDHECSTVEEALERLRCGMYVQIREGSAAKNLENIISGMLEKNMDFNRCIFCTDDKHLSDIKQNGHISYNVKKAIALGVSPIEAICMATINAAECYRLKRLGAIAPGYSADIIILNDLESFNVDKVFYRGKVVYQEGSLNISINHSIEDRNVLSTVRIGSMSKDSLRLPLDKEYGEYEEYEEYATVISLKPNEIITKKETALVKVNKGEFIADEVFSKVAVVERHKATGNIGVGIVKGFNIKNGAIASTVAHDAHNLIVIGDNDDDMFLAIEELKRVNGGYTLVSRGEVLGTLPLPIAGLMSDGTGDYVEKTIGDMLSKAWNLGISKDVDPFITLSFLALPVIPEIRITDKGLCFLG